MKRLRILQTACTLASLLMLAACTQDELTDDGGTSLPEGKYPFQISSVQVVNSPQTRVVESADGNNSSWSWDGTEQIGVKFYDETVTYTLKSGQKLEADKTPYWKSKEPLSVTAWYPTTNGTLDLSNQSTGLKYAMTGSGTGTYNTPVSLSFSHQLAKVCVELTGDAETVKKVTSIGVKGNKKCTVNNGQVSGGTEVGYISMRQPVTNGKYWEANLAPQDISKNDFLQINGEVIKVETTTTGLTAGNYYVFKIEVKNKFPTVPTTGGEYTTGTIMMSGTYTGSVEISGDANLILENAKASIPNTIKVTGGSPTIIVKGTNNEFSGNSAGILISSGANVTIQGGTNNAADSKLTIDAKQFSNTAPAGIGSKDETSCGNITIKNVTLNVTGGSDNTYQIGSAAIGTGAPFGSGCGDIEISNSVITANGGIGAAAIGMGNNSDCGYSIGKITITNTQLTVKTIQATRSITGPGIGLGGAPDHSASTGYQTCGLITITTTESKEAFFSRFDTGYGYKAGKTNYRTYQGFQQWSGIIFNGETLADGNSNGYQ